MVRKKTPEIINIPEGQLDDIKARFEAGAILEDDKKIILLILSTYGWLYRQLRESLSCLLSRTQKTFSPLHKTRNS